MDVETFPRYYVLNVASAACLNGLRHKVPLHSVRDAAGAEKTSALLALGKAELRASSKKT
jgi:hypothetical protein